MIHTVQSSDGILFSVSSDARSAAYDRAFAAVRTADVLEQHGDFERVGPATEPNHWYAPEPPAAPPVEALGRAKQRWGRAVVIEGDRS